MSQLPELLPALDADRSIVGGRAVTLKAFPIECLTNTQPDPSPILNETANTLNVENHSEPNASQATLKDMYYSSH